MDIAIATFIGFLFGMLSGAIWVTGWTLNRVQENKAREEIWKL